MSIRAVICDLDGTLFTPEHTITAHTAATLRRLKEKGIHFIVATGRPYFDVFPTLKKANLSPDYIISSNGARIHDGNHRLVLAHDMDAEAVLSLFQLSVTPNADGSLDENVTQQCDDRQFVVHVNREGDFLTNKFLPEVRKVFDESVPIVEVDPSGFTVADVKGTHSMWIRGDHAILERVQAYAQRNLHGRLTTTFALPFVLDCFPVSVHKGHAVEEVCGLLGISVDESIAFGDGMNDESMLRTSGRGFIMGNAPEKLRNAVPQAEVVLSNSEDGVAVKLEELLFTE